MENSKREQNFWPGFVDALSNLVLTLVFVMVIFVLALFYLSTKVAQSKLEAMCPETKAELADVKKELEETKAALQAALAQAGQVKADIKTAEKAPPPLKIEKLSARASGSGSEITIRFPLGVIELDGNAKEELDRAIQPLLNSGKKIGANLKAYAGPETFSEGKRLSFFRNVAVRNYLMEKGLAKEDIDMKMATAEERDPNDPDGKVTIDLQVAAP